MMGGRFIQALPKFKQHHTLPCLGQRCIQQYQPTELTCQSPTLSTGKCMQVALEAIVCHTCSTLSKNPASPCDLKSIPLAGSNAWMS